MFMLDASHGLLKNSWCVSVSHIDSIHECVPCCFTWVVAFLAEWFWVRCAYFRVDVSKWKRSTDLSCLSGAGLYIVPKNIVSAKYMVVHLLFTYHVFSFNKLTTIQNSYIIFLKHTVGPGRHGVSMHALLLSVSSGLSSSVD